MCSFASLLFFFSGNGAGVDRAAFLTKSYFLVGISPIYLMFSSRRVSKVAPLAFPLLLRKVLQNTEGVKQVR